MRALTDYDSGELAEELAGWGYKPSHAQKLLRAFYLDAGQVDTDRLKLPKSLANRFGTDIAVRQSAVKVRTASSDGTVKLLVGFTSNAGGAVESVLMPAHDPRRAAGCVSSQIGCAMGCDFCASTRRGLERNLEAGEIVEQFLHLRQEARSLGRRLSTLVFMGMGEPMHNLENVITAIRRIAAPNMGELGWRQVTVSTVGIVPGIDKLAEADLNVHLALSLHAPDDATRSQIVPAGRRYCVTEIMQAARRFQDRTGRVVNIEYCLLANVNDSSDQAHALADLMKGFRAHINLIPYNPIGTGLSGRMYERPSREGALGFMDILLKRGVVVHMRRPRGDDVNAACGQLRETVAQLQSDQCR